MAESQELNATRLGNLAAARKAARAYEDVLVAYRQTLRVLLGAGHSDVRAITKMQRSFSAEVAEAAAPGSAPDEQVMPAGVLTEGGGVREGEAA